MSASQCIHSVMFLSFQEQPTTSRMRTMSHNNPTTTTTSNTNSNPIMSHPLVRTLILFFVGCLFAFVLNFLQIQRNVTQFSNELIDNLFQSAWWVPPSCGTAAGKLLHSLGSCVFAVCRVRNVRLAITDVLH